jgi:hypothetical protein
MGDLFWHSPRAASLAMRLVPPIIFRAIFLAMRPVMLRKSLTALLCAAFLG